MVDAALRGNQASFMEQAGQVFAQHRQGADEALAPIKESLALYQTRLAEIENARKEAYGALATELKSVAEGQGMVRAEAAKLVNALRAAPKARGRWGELQLQNLLDASGLTVGVDYMMEQSFNRDDARLRPDVIINLPGGRHIVVDAKAPLTSYMNAIESVDEAERDLQLKAHAAAVRGHVKQLSSKEYQRALVDTVDFVALFMPGDNLLAAAVERDPDLLTDAMRDRVFIVTPVTMMALAKVVAFGWRQEKVAENAKQVHDLGAELFRRLQKMGEQVGAVGKNLNQTVGRYNEFVASLESRVLPQARRFTELSVAGGEEIPALTTVDVAVKEPRRDRDLLFDGNAPTKELT
jgi:DNA recombination protein RmuC